MKVAKQLMNGIGSWLLGRTVESEPISDAQWDALLADVSEGPPHLGIERRHESRLAHQQVAQLFLDLGQRNGQRFIVRTRDLSQLGMGFVHSKPVEPGMPCRIMLISRDMKIVQRQAVVASCRRQDDVFLVGIKLDKEIEPDHFVVPPDKSDPSMWIS